ncbi:hypothetical protein SAMN04489867_0269 [Pedococcus dokdonensis]|uniref:Inner membrane protein n=1 Tax=Pedococcus dokdonensis TaxID=443156 RepID=A0A1H0LE39_9MICO|nr:hypothetical protein [Pedococcus dokdonensis]SDO66293.1 hypothetical protein SAMN04489867_0269 [Pedococcus dokdonensis]
MLMVTFQALGAVAIALGLLGTWLAARRRSGWLLCIASCGLWFPTLWSGEQWVAVANCFLTVGICLRNFRTQARSAPAEA